MRPLLFLLVAVSFISCVGPEPEILRPGARGIVIDALSRRPIGGAFIDVQPSSSRFAAVLPPSKSAITYSREDGSFLVPSQTASEPFTGSEMPVVLQSPIVIEKHGYLAFKGEVVSSQAGSNRSSVEDMGIVVLRPIPR